MMRMNFSDGDCLQGSSYLFRYITSIDQWLLESTLGPDTGVDQDNFGSDLSLFGRYMAIGSPGDDTLADNAVSGNATILLAYAVNLCCREPSICTGSMRLKIHI